MTDPIVGAIAGPIFKKLWQAGGSAIQGIRDQYSEVDAINKLLAASAEYEQRYRKRHGLIRVMPGLMKEPVPLENIYTAVKLLDDRDIRYFRTEQDLEEAYRQAGRRSFQVGGNERRDGIAIANEKQYLMVLGGPGIGKSTFLRKLGIEALKGEAGQLTHRRIPVLLELKEMRDPEISLVGAIAKEFEVCGFPAAEAFTQKTLEQGKLLVLLDGLDEVPKQNLNRVITAIEDLVDRHDKNCFVASCRIAARSGGLDRFTDVTIAEFDDEQIEQFIQRWFRSELDQRNQTAEKYCELLTKPEHKATKELAQTPLLLTFLCLVYDREQTLPSTRSTLYGDALNILLKEWAAQKRLERDPIYEGFHPDLEKVLLAQIAYDTFEQDKLFFSKADITARIAEFLADTLDAPKHLDASAVLKAIEVQQGLLVERATDTYSFSHLTIQEYLTAYHIVERDLLDDVVAEHAIDERWREVFLLLAGLMGGKVLRLWQRLKELADTLFKASQKGEEIAFWMNSECRKNLKLYESVSYILSAIVNQFDSTTTVAAVSDRDRITRVIFSLPTDEFISIKIPRASVGDLDLFIHLYRATPVTEDSDKEVASQRFKLELLCTHASSIWLSERLLKINLSESKRSAGGEGWFSWHDTLLPKWLKETSFRENTIFVSRKDVQILANYVYLTKLIICCKDSALRVSKKDWEAIEVRLLTLPESNS